MEKKKSWGSGQALIVLAIIVVMMIYVGLDAFHTTPLIREQVDSVKVEYKNLSKFLDKKIPEIDSTLIMQANQINKQTSDIEDLKTSLKKVSEKE